MHGYNAAITRKSLPEMIGLTINAIGTAVETVATVAIGTAFIGGVVFLALFA